MKSKGTLVLAFVAVAFLTGCPLESDVPPGNPGPGSLDPQLRGKWVAGTLYHKFIELECIPFNENEYFVELRPEGKELERYRAYTVRVGSEPFLVISEVKDEKGRRPYYLARYAFGRDGALTLRFVGEKAVPKGLGRVRGRPGWVRRWAAAPWWRCRASRRPDRRCGWASRRPAKVVLPRHHEWMQGVPGGVAAPCGDRGWRWPGRLRFQWRRRTWVATPPIPW